MEVYNKTYCKSKCFTDESRAGIFESRFNEIFCQRSYSHLRAVFHEYELLTGHSIEKGIEKHFSSDAKSCLMAIVESVRSMSAFFAKRLHESMQGYGTNDDRLIRIIVTRSEIDMADIKDDYERMYCKSLKHDIKVSKQRTKNMMLITINITHCKSLTLFLFRTRHREITEEF